MSASEAIRVLCFLFMGLVGLLFSVRMYVRARRASGRFAFPPHWYDVVAIYLSGFAVVVIGISARIVAKHLGMSQKSLWAFGLFYVAYGVVTSALALYFWRKPQRLVNAPSAVPAPPIPEVPVGGEAE